MRIGVIGAGHIGATTARLFAEAGHEVKIANSRGIESLAEEFEDDDGIEPATVEDAADFGEIVLLAIPLKAYTELPADELADTIVIDATNYYPGRDGQIEELDTDAVTSTELIGRHLYGSRLVKAFNTLAADTLEDEGGRAAGDHSRLAMLVSADDEGAKTEVMDLIDEIGFDPFDLGDLAEGGRLQQPGSELYGLELTNVQARDALGMHIRGVND
jgi:predicted dinucleotide-binding enzyme